MTDRGEHTSEEGAKLAEIMAAMTIAFAKTGDPSTADVPVPAWGSEGGDTPGITTLLGTAGCYADVAIERESDPDSRVSLVRRAFGRLWSEPLF